MVFNYLQSWVFFNGADVPLLQTISPASFLQNSTDNEGIALFSSKTPFARYQTLVLFTGWCDGCSVLTPFSFLYFLMDSFTDQLESWDFFTWSSTITGMKSKNLLNYLVMMYNLETEEHICCIFYFGFSQIYNSSWSVRLNLQRAVLCISRQDKEMFPLIYFINPSQVGTFFLFILGKTKVLYTEEPHLKVEEIDAQCMEATNSK